MNTMKQWLAVFATVFAITASSVSTQAAKPQPSPSPFAGVWCGFGFPVTISDSGQVSGKGGFLFADDASLNGRISNDGILNLTLSYTISGCFGECNKPNRGKTRIKITGVAALDDNGNLIGLWSWNTSELFPFEWTPCQ